MFLRIQVFKVQVFQGPGFSRVQVFQVQVFLVSGFLGSKSKVWVQVLEIAYKME